MVLVVGMAVVVAEVAGVALLVAGMAQAPGQAAAGKALMPLGMLPLRGLALLRCQQHPTSLLGTSWPHLGPGPAQVVKAMGAPAQAPAARGKYFHCNESGHFQAQCPLRALGGPPSGSM